MKKILISSIVILLFCFALKSNKEDFSSNQEAAAIGTCCWQAFLVCTTPTTSWANHIRKENGPCNGGGNVDEDGNPLPSGG